MEPPQHALSHGRPRRVQSEAARVAVATCPNAVAAAAVTTLHPSWEPRSESVRKRPGWTRSPLRLRPRSVTGHAERRYGSRSRRSSCWPCPVRRVSQLMGDDDSATPRRRRATRRRRPLGPTDTTTPEYPNPDLAEQVLAREPPAPQPPPADTPADALESTTLIEGEGEGAVAGDTITVHYARGAVRRHRVRRVVVRRGSRSPSTLGTGQVIPGWDQGLDRREDRRAPAPRDRRRQRLRRCRADGSIPPNAPLAFDVDVVDIQPAAAAVDVRPARSPRGLQVPPGTATGGRGRSAWWPSTQTLDLAGAGGPPGPVGVADAARCARRPRPAARRPA